MSCVNVFISNGFPRTNGVFMQLLFAFLGFLGHRAAPRGPPDGHTIHMAHTVAVSCVRDPPEPKAAAFAFVVPLPR